jgi:hypothetical protein
VGDLMSKFHSGNYNEMDVHALHVFMQSYIKTRVNPPVITDHKVAGATSRLARLISVQQDYGYRKGKPVDTERMKSYLETPKFYPDEKEPVSLTKEFGKLLHADSNMASYEKGEDMTVTFRGSRTNAFDPNFAKDWKYNMQTTFSDASTAKHLEKSKTAVDAVKKLLRENPHIKNLKISGYSQGGGLAHHVAEEIADDFPGVKISAETFNAHINMLHNFKDPKCQHTIHRTSEDPATLALGYKAIDPSKIHVHTYGSLKECDNALDSHALRNFTEYDAPRAHYNLMEEAMDRQSVMEGLIREQKIAGLSESGINITPDQMDSVVDHITVDDLEGSQEALHTKVARIMDPLTSQVNEVGTEAMPPPMPSTASNVRDPPSSTPPMGHPTETPPEPRLEPVP